MKKKDQKYVVVRSSPSGVWFGVLESRKDREVVLTNARRAWSWTGALSCSELAVSGPTGGKISVPVSRVVVMDCCEVIDATKQSVAAWEGIK